MMHAGLTGGADLAAGDLQRPPDGGGGSKTCRSHVLQDGHGAVNVAGIGGHLDHGVVRDLAALLRHSTPLSGRQAWMGRCHQKHTPTMIFAKQDLAAMLGLGTATCTAGFAGQEKERA